MSEPKKTPLYVEHVRLNGRIVDFAGWALPVEFTGLRTEHDTVRNKVGLFDVSHMGEVFVRGPKALETLQWLTTNDVSKLKVGQAQYNLLPNKTGGLVDDIFIYCLREHDDYLVCVNAANREKDVKWMKENNRGADIRDESDDWSQIAVQGPFARKLLARIFPFTSDMTKNQCHPTKFQGVDAIVACTGYTGEDGCEVFIKNEGAIPLWQELLAKGADLGVAPIGLGARDTLRTEMKYSLYGHEISDETSPLEAGLGWVVKLAKGEFIGREAIAKVKEAGPKRQLVGFKLVDKGIPRDGYSLFSFDNQEIGKVTSGTLSPSLNEAIGIGYVPVSLAKEGSEFFVDIRGRKAKARVVKTPFVNPKGAT